MKYSENKIDYITNYIATYKNKIKVLNKEGLFNNAKLFELFASKVCEIIFKQKFNNLNVEKFNYPYVDLISHDGNIGIQVSTVEDVPNKIRKTLEKIAKSDNTDIKKIKEIYFFVLDNASISEVKSYTGINKIGNLDFKKEKNLITTQTIIHKATTDSEFLDSLFDLIQKDENSFNNEVKNFYTAVKYSKDSVNHLKDTIGNDYHIDVTQYIDHIKQENHKNIFIIGKAGSGKTVLCKKLIEKESCFLYARAERFNEETNLNRIWNFDLDTIVKTLDKKTELIIFIDALEYISDNAITKLELLQELYCVINDYPNIKTIASCRTLDTTTFIKLQTDFNIKCYEIQDINQSTILDLIKKFPILLKLSEQKSYNELLTSPFYINIIVEKIDSLDKISNINDFRKHLWNKIICLNDNKYKKIINGIVFDRAKNFSIFADTSQFNSNDIKKLQSENIIILDDNNNARLKYDIFEDICFEQYIDSEFNNCKEDYVLFFKNIEKKGRCIERRFQIWFDHKLTSKENCNKYIYGLLFCKNISQKWIQTVKIALVRSDNSQMFFEDYAQILIKNKKLFTELIDITNLHCFTFDFVFNFLPHLKKAGIGRNCLINIIAENDLYKDDIIQYDKLRKLLADYSNHKPFDVKTSQNAVKILTYFINKKTDLSSNYFELIKDDLHIMYQLCDVSTTWLLSFFNKIETNLVAKEPEKLKFAENVVSDLLQSLYPDMTHIFAAQICKLIEKYFTYSRPKTNLYPYDFYDSESKNDNKYGLNHNADDYKYSHNNKPLLFLSLSNYFLHDDGLAWLINFINKRIDSYNKHSKLIEQKIYFYDTNSYRNYYGNEQLWLALSNEYQLPFVISDLVYSFKEAFRRYLNNKYVNLEEKITRANKIKEYIFTNSNNILLLNVISEVGMEFSPILSGYALDLISNINLVLFDLTRLTLQIKNPDLEKYQNLVFRSMGLPNVPQKRYKPINTEKSLREYAYNCQLKEATKEKCLKIIDYLYSNYSDEKNDKETANKCLQVQLMDSRISKKEQIGDYTLIRQELTGKAKEFANNKSPEDELIINIDKQLTSIVNNGKTSTLDKQFTVMNLLFGYINNTYCMIHYSKLIIEIMSALFKETNLSAERRSFLIDSYLNIVKGYNTYFLDEIIRRKLSENLIQQFDYEFDVKTKLKLKKYLLDLILYDHQNYIVDQLRLNTIVSLNKNPRLPKILFNTIIMLAEDEMKHFMYNSNIIKKHQKDFTYSPNLVYFGRSDLYLEQEKEKLYNSQINNIISDYLYNEKTLDIKNFEISNYDARLVCYALNCGLDLSDDNYKIVIKKFTKYIINYLNENHDYQSRVIKVYEEEAIIKSFQNILISNNFAFTKDVLSILFDNFEFSKFSNDTINLYEKIFSILLPLYFNEYGNTKIRNTIETVIRELEKYILSIENEDVKKRLYKILFFGANIERTGDWSKCKTEYPFQNKLFINEMFSKYGFYDFGNCLKVMERMHIEELMPEIITPLKICIENYLKTNKNLNNHTYLLNYFISIAFFRFNDKIKQNQQLIENFESILNILISNNNEIAAVLLNEFRIH